MPFERITPRPFTLPAIQNYAPAGEGVYGITNSRQWIFIGETDNIQAALLEHLRDLGTSLLSHQPAGFVYEQCGGARRAERQNRLVTEYAPILSAKGKNGNSHR